MGEARWKVVLALLYFFVILGCFGLLSRAISEASVPIVAVTEASPGAVVVEGGSQPFRQCVPACAVYQDGANAYVYVVEGRSGFFGEEDRVRRVNVTIAAQDAESVAVTEGSLAPTQKVVVDSSRMIADGDVVRVANETP